MLRRLLLLFACVPAVAFADESGFVSLFDGRSLDGWVQRGGEATYEIDANAEGGAQIIGTSVVDTPNSFLCTDRDYADFVLEFEVKVHPKLNSGVQFRSACHDAAKKLSLVNAAGETYEKRVPAGRVYGYQAEIDPSDRSYSGGVYDEARRGWLYDLGGDENAAARAAFNRDGWNHYRVEAVGDHLKTFVNGVPAADFHDDVSPTGFIALQVHSIGSPDQAGKQVRWRNLRIKEIAAE